MKKTFAFLKKNYGKIYRIFLFIISIALIVYLFPKEGKFRYEFHKGSPWSHDNLYAPFDFAIYKLEKELTFERDSILKDFNPYFSYNDQIEKNQISSFTSKFESEWDEYHKQDSINNLGDSIPKYNLSEYNQDSVDFYFNKTTDLIKFVYLKGIAEYTQVLEVEDNEDVTLVVVKNNIAEEYDYPEIFTLKSSYQYIINELNNQEENLVQNNELEFIKNLDINEFLQPNIFYDEEMSSKVRGSLTDNISLTRGMVQRGERIIFKGEVVDEDKFRVLESLKTEYEASLGTGSTYLLILAGQVIFVLVSFIVIFLFLVNFRKEIIEDGRKTLFILMLIVLIVVLANIIIRLNIISIYLVPFAILPIIIRTFYDSRLALFIHLMTILLIGFIAPNSFEFVFLQVIAGIVAIFSLTKLYRRGQLFASAGIVFATYCLIYFGIAITQEESVSNIEWMNFAWFAGNGLLLLSSYPMIYVFEKLFGFLSDVTLLELSDSNQPLLRKLAEEAPGTFQHSMQVANLAEEAIYKIGGNPLLVRTGALYHDIGKMNTPLFFIENQISGVNPHDDLEFDKSAEVIIDHVTRGVEIAQRYNLPKQIIDFIRTHHGKSKVQYFYKSFINKYPDKEVNLDKFTYPGPDPYSKETATLMMADSVEAASRSVKKISEKSINDLVDSIIDFQIKEGLFNNSDITFKDITEIKKIFKKKIFNIYHTRIEYPK